MPSYLCLICHSTVFSDTNAETRQKYMELIGMKLCNDSHLCHICCHLLKKLWLFKSICLRRSMEYPVLFNDKGAVTLQNSNIETIVLCPENDECEKQTNIGYHFTSDIDNTDINQHVSLEERNDATIDIIEEEKVDEEQTEFNDDNISNDDHNDYETEEQNVATENDVEESKPKESNKNNEYYKVILSVEEQKAELDEKRRQDKYLEAEFKCYNCAMGFLFKDTYQAHMMRHEESNGSHLCPICLLRFATSRVLRAHATLHRERVSCARCRRHVAPRRVTSHLRRCAGVEQPAICHLCSKMFNDANGLQQHIKRFHIAKTSNKTYSCHVCGKTYNNQAAVRTHMIKHINKKFTCSQCPATFSSPYTLTQHSKTHSNTQQGGGHRCQTCRVTYSSRKSYVQHRRRAQCHQPNVSICPICSRQCANQHSLAAHVQTVHSGSKPHACPWCAARYSSRKALGSHVRRHRGTEPELGVCHVCGASFKGNNKLNRHLRSVCEKNKLEEELSAFYNQECQE